MKIDYPRLVDEALRGVVRDLLASVAEEGLPEGHQLYFTFDTEHPGLEMPSTLRERYLEEMTIVLQHQFWDLMVEEEAFEVTLRFGGRPHHLRVPYAALKTFVDPGARFGLRFETEGSSMAEGGGQAREGVDERSVGQVDDSGGQVVSLDDFRKKDH